MKIHKCLVLLAALIWATLPVKAGYDTVLVWINGGYMVVAGGINTVNADRYYYNGGPWDGDTYTIYNPKTYSEMLGDVYLYPGPGTWGEPRHWWEPNGP